MTCSRTTGKPSVVDPTISRANTRKLRIVSTIATATTTILVTVSPCLLQPCHAFQPMATDSSDCMTAIAARHRREVWSTMSRKRQPSRSSWKSATIIPCSQHTSMKLPRYSIQCLMVTPIESSSLPEQSCSPSNLTTDNNDEDDKAKRMDRHHQRRQQQEQEQKRRVRGINLRLDELMMTFQLVAASLFFGLVLISWEDVSMSHPMRIESAWLGGTGMSGAYVTESGSSLNGLELDPSLSSTISPGTTSRWGQSTVRGMGFGQRERYLVTKVAGDLESYDFDRLKSYNEVMNDHRTYRVPSFFSQPATSKDDDWMKGYNVGTIGAGSRAGPSNQWMAKLTTMADSNNAISEQDVVSSIDHLKRVVLKLQDCKTLASNYEWEQLRSTINEPTLRGRLNSACYVLKHASNILSSETRDVVGFDWGSCAWRHCGALADIQESLDELEASLGVLEPFEALFCLDVVERGVRDMIDVMPTKLLQKTDQSIVYPTYEPLKRMSDVSEEDRVDGMDRDYLEALEFLRSTEPSEPN